MAGRIYEAKNCIKYGKSILSDIPLLELNLYNLKGEKFPGKLLIPIDTGFEGSIMLSNEDYEFFQIAELPEEYWRTYRTLAGTVIMRVSYAIVEVNNIKFQTYVETPRFGVGTRLIGREVLNKLTIILDGKNKLVCLAD